MLVPVIPVTLPWGEGGGGTPRLLTSGFSLSPPVVVVSLQCSGFAEQCIGCFVMLCCWKKGDATCPAAAAAGPCHCPPGVSGKSWTSPETLLLSLFWFAFVFYLFCLESCPNPLFSQQRLESVKAHQPRWNHLFPSPTTAALV